MAKDFKISLLNDFYGALLTEKQQESIKLYYNEDLSLAEIAQFDAITRQGVRDSIKRAEGQLLEFEERLGLYHRFEIVKKTLDEIKASADEIEELNERLHGSNQIMERCRKIKELAEQIEDE